MLAVQTRLNVLTLTVITGALTLGPLTWGALFIPNRDTHLHYDL